jgi:hypothetical protein
MNIKFVKQYLLNIKWNNAIDWQVEGNIKKLSNQYLKFDIRYLSDFPKDKKGKLINSNNQSDKILFENDKNWILVDTQELIKYMKECGLKEIKLEELIKNIDWNIILPKIN